MSNTQTSGESTAIIDERVSVAIVDDHDAIRLGFKAACEDYGFDLLASAPSVDALIPALDDVVPQVVVLDLSLSDGSLVEDNVTRVRELGSQILIFSIADKRNLIRAAIKAGAAAIVPKAQSMDELASAIRLVANGIYVNNTQTTAAIDSDLEFKEAKLSPREREVLTLYASGLALKQVAFSLNIKMNTAKEHIDRVRSKYADIGRPVSSKTELLLRAIEDGLIDESSI
jgi:two-component system uhpT operon response regulator UhpA